MNLWQVTSLCKAASTIGGSTVIDWANRTSKGRWPITNAVLLQVPQHNPQVVKAHTTARCLQAQGRTRTCARTAAAAEHAHGKAHSAQSNACRRPGQRLQMPMATPTTAESKAAASPAAAHVRRQHMWLYRWLPIPNIPQKLRTLLGGTCVARKIKELVSARHRNQHEAPALQVAGCCPRRFLPA